MKWLVVFTVIFQQGARMKRSKSTWWKTSSLCTHINQPISVQFAVLERQTMFSTQPTKREEGKKQEKRMVVPAPWKEGPALSGSHWEGLNKDTESLEMASFLSDTKRKKGEQPTSHISYPDWEAMAPTTETLEGGGRRAQGISQRFTSFLVMTRQPKALPPPPEATQLNSN